MDGEEDITYDDVLKELGELGRFQLISCSLICLSIIFSGANFQSFIFVSGVPIVSCKDPVCDEGTSFKNETCDKYLKGDLPTVADIWKIETCKDFTWKVASIANTQFGFILVGCFLFGSLSDRFGRKQMYLTSALIMFVGGVSRIICTTYYNFIFLTVIYALGISGIYPGGFVLGIELVGKSKRECVALFMNICFALGEAAVGMVAYLNPDWKNIQLIISGPAILFTSFFFFIPESARWLMVKGRVEEAILVLDKADGMTNGKISINTLKRIVALEHREYEIPETASKISPTLKIILRSKILIIRYIIVFFLWIFIAFAYYAISLNITNMVGNPYLNFALISLIEIPGYLVASLAIYKFGRKWPLMFCICVSAVGSIIEIFLTKHKNWIKIVNQLTIKLFSAAAFQIVYIYTAEIYPTIVRSIGVTTSSSLAKLGGFLASFVPIMGNSIYPAIISAVLSTATALLILRIPETRRKKLPDTVDEAIEL